jgi:hypothetical protein
MTKPRLTIVGDTIREPDRLTPDDLRRWGFGPDAPLVAAPTPPEPDYGWIEGEFVVRRRTRAEAEAAERAEAEFEAAVLRVVAKRAREGLAARRASPEAKAAREAALERLVHIVDAACDAAGREPACSAPCLSDIRPYLPKRHGASDRRLLDALGVARIRRKRSTPKTI